MQLRHAVAARALEAHHRDEVTLQLAGGEGIGQLLLILEHQRRGLDQLVLEGHGRDLHHPAPEVALHQTQAALGGEGIGHRTQHALVVALARAIAPDQLAVLEEGLTGVTREAMAGHGVDVLVQQPGIEQLANQQGHAASCLEVVDIGLAVGIDVGQGRGHGGQIGHVLPGQLDAGGAGDGRHMQGVIGRAAGGAQGDDGVDQAALVDDLAQRHKLPALPGQAGDLLRRLVAQGIAQWGARIDKGRARQVQAHHLHQQLVGVGGAVEGAGAGAVVGGHLGLQQLVARRLALGIALAHVGLFLVRQSGRHGPGRHEQARQMAEAQRAHQQAGDDLVADTQVQRGIEHVVRQRHRGGHGDHLAAGDAQFHARLALGHAVAHGRHTAGELADRADFAQGLLDPLGIVFIGLVSREHVVISRNNRYVGRVHQAQGLLVFAAAAGHAVGEIGTLQLAALRAFAGRRANHRQIGLARGAATGDQAVGYLKYAGMHVVDSRLAVSDILYLIQKYCHRKHLISTLTSIIL